MAGSLVHNGVAGSGFQPTEMQQHGASAPQQQWTNPLFASTFVAAVTPQRRRVATMK